MDERRSSDGASHGGFGDGEGLLSRLDMIGGQTEANGDGFVALADGSAPFETNGGGSHSNGQALVESLRHFAGNWQEVKTRLHDQLVAKLNFDTVEQLSESDLHGRFKSALRAFVKKNIPPELTGCIDRMTQEVHDRFLGAGPLELLLRDDGVTEVMVNGPSQIHVEREGQILPTSTEFQGEGHIRWVLGRILKQSGHRLDVATSMVGVSLLDGSRLNAALPPLSRRGSVISIRRFSLKAYSFGELIGLGALSSEMAAFLRAAVLGTLNIVVSGRAGSGKTTMLNLLASLASPRERIVTVEHSPELALPQDLVVSLGTREAGPGGGGEVNMRDLIRFALQMRADRIVVGECRGGEAFDILQAMCAGLGGSMLSLQANSPRDALARMGALAMMAGVDLPERCVYQHLASAIDLIVHLERYPDGSRKIAQISEVTGAEGDVISLQTIFRFQGKYDAAERKVLGRHKAMDVSPRSARKLGPPRQKPNGF